MSQAKLYDNPPTKIFLRSKAGLRCYFGPPPVCTELINNLPFNFRPDENMGCQPALRIPPIISPNGSMSCIIKEADSPLLLMSNNDGSLLGEIPCCDAQSVEWSPLGNFLVTWSRNTKNSTENEGNLRVWSVASKECVATYNQRQQRKESIQWTSDESVCIRAVSNELHILRGQDIGAGIVNKIYHKGLVQFKLSPVLPITVAVFNPQTGGNPARVSLHRCDDINNPVVANSPPITSRTVSGASEASMIWNLSGTSLLIHTQSDVDSTDTSYYGATGLFLMTADGNISMMVPQRKEGPIHDVKWSPDGTTFIVAAGNMPSSCTLFSDKAEAVYEFGTAHRNTISWSPHGRFACLAGFGNLAGEMDFYDVKKFKKVGSNTAHCTVSYGWSPCSRYFLTATLAPRMNVDNGIKLYLYNGVGPVFEHHAEQLYDAYWLPCPPSKYENRGPSPPATRNAVISNGRLSSEAEAKPVAPVKPAAYRPPGSSGQLSGLLKKEREGGSVASGKVPVGSGGAAVAKPAAAKTYQAHQRVIPGMPPPAPPAAASDNNKKKAIKKTEPASSSVTTPPIPPTSTVGNSNSLQSNNTAASSTSNGKAKATSAPSPSPVVPVTTAGPSAVPSAASAIEPLDIEKKIKNLRKKLKGISELKDKVAGGLVITDVEQKRKLESESTLMAELDTLLRK